MKILVATNETQGQRESDFTFLVAGELVYLAAPCGSDDNDPDGGCGCGRAWAGLVSRKGGTTAQVVDLDITLDGYVDLLRGGLDAAIWDDQDVDELAAALADIAADHDIGVVLERRGDDIEARDAQPG